MSANDNLKLNRNHLDLRNGIAIKRVTITDASQMPKDYCTTPSGNTLFSTTPGGTRIIYDRAFLMSRKESPLAKSPPANLPYIPEITLIPPKDNSNLTKNLCNDSNKETTINREDTHDHNHNQTVKKDIVDNTQFEMDI